MWGYGTDFDEPLKLVEEVGTDAYVYFLTDGEANSTQWRNRLPALHETMTIQAVFFHTPYSNSSGMEAMKFLNNTEAPQKITADE